MPRAVRRQLLVDPKVQGTLLMRAGLYWCYCLITVWALLAVWQIATSPQGDLLAKLSQASVYFGPAFLATCLVLPAVLYDLVKVSNRIVGPLYRVRRSLRKLALGQVVDPVYFRQGDFWHEMAEEYNAVLARVEQLEADLQAALKELGRAKPTSSAKVAGSAARR